MTGRQRIEAALLIGVLLGTAALGWWLSLQPSDRRDASSFDAIPYELNGWKAIDLEMQDGVAELLRADHHVQRVYLHPLGYTAYLYVGYYGTERGGAPEHTPDNCYPAQGWQVQRDDTLVVGGRSSGLSVREFIVEKSQELRLVHFWYRTEDRSGFTSTLGLRARQLWGRLIENRGDGALVRLSTPVVGGDLDAARSRLLGLDTVVEAAIDEIWPRRT